MYLHSNFSPKKTRLVFSRKIWKKFFDPEKLKKRASKVAHNQPRPFHFTVQPRPMAHSPELIFHNMKSRDQTSVLLSVGLGQVSRSCSTPLKSSNLKFDSSKNIVLSSVDEIATRHEQILCSKKTQQLLTFYWKWKQTKTLEECWSWNLKTWNNQVQACTTRLPRYLGGAI